MHKLKLLIIDDHQLIIEGYKNILNFKSSYQFDIVSANSCRQAFNIISNATNLFDIVFLDWMLPPYPNKQINDGGDVILHIRRIMPNAKIVILTSHEEAFELYGMIKKYDPSGLLVKCDFTAEDLLTAVDNVIAGDICYSETVKRGIREINSRNKYLDNFNRQIILLLSKGVKTKNMPTYLPLSLSAIDKRKAIIRDYFLLEKGNDEDIIMEARKAGLI